VRVVFLVIDGLPARRVGPRLTPHLDRLMDGVECSGRAVMTSATYPNHATFVTGADPATHRLLANFVVTGDGPQPAQTVGPAVPTLIDACRDAGRSTGAAVGDHNLVGVMGLAAADEHWPDGGMFAADIARDGHGYATDGEVLRRLLPLLVPGGPDLVIGHINEPDTAGHVHGPDSAEAGDCYNATDARLGEIVTALQPCWDDTVLIVVSDHDQETMGPDDPIDLYAPVAADGLGLIPIPEGNGAVVWGDDPSGGRWLDTIPGVAGHADAWPGARVVWAEPTRRFALPPWIDQTWLEPGHHGGATTRTQVAAVGGGHPRAEALRRAIATRGVVDATAWAPTAAALLDVPLPTATGGSLVDG